MKKSFCFVLGVIVSSVIPCIANAQTSGLTVSPASLTFTSNNGSIPAPRTLAVSASGEDSIRFTTAVSASAQGHVWLSVAAPTGTLRTNQVLTVSANPAGLVAGTYDGTISLRTFRGTTTVPVTFAVTFSSTLAVAPTALSFAATAGGAPPPAKTLSVTATTVTNFTVTTMTQSGGSWLSVSPPGTLTTPRTLTVSVNPSGLVANTYSGAISILVGGAIRVSVPITFVVSPVIISGGPFKVVAWNDLGMHCDDGKDYRTAGFLPPFNTAQAQVVDMSGKLVTSPSGFTLTYEAVADSTGAINRTSIGKTNFWTYITSWGFGTFPPDVGFFGYAMPGTANVPQAMAFNPSDNTWVARAIPLTPVNDDGTIGYFPMMRITAKNSSGTVLASTDIVLPISDEVSCGVCHASSTGTIGAMPLQGWVNNPDPNTDMKLNLLRKHDERFRLSVPFQAAAAQVGYSPAGLEATTVTKPVMCYACHGTPFVPIAGVTGVPPLTRSIHGLHAGAIDPATNATLDSGTTRNACYTCHPGPKTQCLRGAMGSLKNATGGNAIECQSCHGNLSALAAVSRTGWFSEPNCANCHTGLASATNTTLAFTSAFTSGTTLRTPADNTFASNANSPTAGVSLFRTSKGHGGLQCEACHGSTHAEFPTPIVNDNVQSNNLQGHEGMLVECATCHTTVPNTTIGGPHGMHPVGSSWVSRHQDVADNNRTQCQACHGIDYRGTILSKMQANRTLAGRSFTRGTVIGCYSCHNGPNGG